MIGFGRAVPGLQDRVRHRVAAGVARAAAGVATAAAGAVTAATRQRLAAATAVATAAAIAAATAPLVACDEDAFTRWSSELRERCGAANEVDTSAANEHLAERAAQHGDLQFIWQTLRQGERRIKRVAMFRWLEGDPMPAPDGEAPVAGCTRLSVLVEVGNELNGHPGVVHGGFTAALLDDLLGWTASSEKRARGLDGASLTANLNVNYKRPLYSDGAFLVELRADRIEKRKKVFLSATVKDSKGRVCVEATSLYIIKKLPPQS